MATEAELLNWAKTKHDECSKPWPIMSGFMFLSFLFVLFMTLVRSLTKRISFRAPVEEDDEEKEVKRQKQTNWIPVSGVQAGIANIKKKANLYMILGLIETVSLITLGVIFTTGMTCI